MRRLVLIPRKKRYAYAGGHRPVRLRKTEVQTSIDEPSSPTGLKSGGGAHPEVGSRNYDQLGSKHGTAHDKAQTTDPLDEFDEYGTELHKDARVWKVYVDEADEHDIELVNGWNERHTNIREHTLPARHTIDVVIVLVQAALFSAISTAFLIESSKLLQPDPAEESVRSLLTISQTLSVIANGTQSPGSIPAPSGDPAEFIPSRAAIWINVLWYISLGLSLATSFIAILAKDWCHSFMSGRTGHPYSQMCRRQRKWNMIEKWKMSELLTILPSLIHIALLLFSVGLCIYLSETHVAVAIPIFCATGAAVGFYIWSSVAAISIDYFPYPTIVSRVCRTKVARRAFQATSAFASQLASHPAVRNICQMVLVLVFASLWALEMLLYTLLVPCFCLAVLEDLLDECNIHLSRSPPLLQLVAIPLSKAVQYLLSYPGLMAGKGVVKLGEYSRSSRRSIKSRLSSATWGLEWKDSRWKPAAQANGDENNQGDTTSLALSWLITNCEVPQSVDIALQSIAGATSRISRQPLLDCHATLEILRRLASSNLYKGSDARTDIIISLYSRALTQLGGTTGSASDTEPHGSGSELEGLIWDVHLESETRMAASIVDGSFDPTSANLNALRIGNTAASNTLKLLGRDSQKIDVDVDKMIGSIVDRLESHVMQIEPLHDAALLSLFNAAALLLPFAPEFATSRHLPLLFVKVVEHHSNGSTRRNPALINLGCVCAQISSVHLDPGSPGLESQGNRSLLRHIVDRIFECYMEGTAIARTRLMFGLEMLATCPETSQPPSFDLRAENRMLDQAASTILALYSSFLAGYQAGSRVNKSEDDLVQSLRALRRPLSLVLVKTLPTVVPFLLLGPIQRLWSLTRSPVDGEWEKLASYSRFPTPSRALIRLMEQSDFISHLEAMIEGGDSAYSFIALGQLWLLYTAYLDMSSDSTDEQERFGIQLKRYNRSQPASEQVQRARIGDQLVVMWESAGVYLGAWPARLMECVHQSRNSPPPQGIHEALQTYNVPDDLRGLSSFTSWRPRSTESKTSDRSRSTNDCHAIAHGNDSDSGTPVPDIDRTSVAYVVCDTGMDGNTSPCDTQGATCEGSRPKNLTSGVPDGGGAIESAGNPTALEGQEVGEAGVRTVCPAVELGHVGNTVDDGSHISIDICASEKVPK